MPVESATYISQLSSSDPAGGDQKSQGDDHLRLVKNVLKATFPNANRAVRFPSTVVTQTGNFTLGLAEGERLTPVNASGGAITVTLPATAERYDGIVFHVQKTDYSANAVTIDGNASDTINGQLTITLTKAFQDVKAVWSEANSAWFARISPVVPTGTLAAFNGTASPVGWVLASGTKTIGNASSGSTERANADTEALFVLLWNTYSNSVCAVSGGRGASGIADFGANKTLTLPDLRGRTIFGKDDLGGTAASRLITITGTIMGTSGGGETVTVAQANLPSVNLSGTADSGGAHTHTGSVLGGNNGGSLESGTNRGSTQNFTTSSNGDHTHTVTVPLGGSGTALNKLPPAFVMGWIIAL